MLTPRQLACYQNTITIVRPNGTTVVAGEPQDATFSVVATAVPCHYAYTLNDDDASPVGRVKRRSALTEDAVHCEITTDLQSGDLVYDTTAGSPNAGAWGRVEGAPKRIVGSGLRTTNKLSAQVMEEEHPPAGAVALV